MVGVVLVNWNGLEFTLPCLKSLYSGIIPPDIVVIVDNGSTDGSIEQIKKEYPEITLIENPNNVGFSGANNQGIQHLLQLGVKYIWILNNDTIVDKSCLYQLKKTLEDNPQAVGVSGMIYYENPSHRIWYAGGDFHPLHYGVIHKNTVDKFEHNQSQPVKFISGCCMFTTAAIWRDCGGFIDSFVAYSEDQEWCWRVFKNNKILIFDPEAILWHRLSASVKKNIKHAGNVAISPYIQYLMVRNHLWTIRIHAQRFRKYIAFLSIFVLNIKNIFHNLFRGNIQNSISIFKALYEGMNSALPSKHNFK